MSRCTHWTLSRQGLLSLDMLWFVCACTGMWPLV